MPSSMPLHHIAFLKVLLTKSRGIEQFRFFQLSLEELGYIICNQLKFLFGVQITKPFFNNVLTRLSKDYICLCLIYIPNITSIRE